MNIVYKGGILDDVNYKITKYLIINISCIVFWNVKML